VKQAVRNALRGVMERTASRAKSPRSLAYSTSPLLASKTPSWRSKFVVFLVGGSFLVLVGRAAFVQVIDADFYVNEGEKRYAHTLDVPAVRGRITDRNGQLLATSVAASSIWAIPKEFEATKEQRRQLARALGMTPEELGKRLADNPRFVWLRRQAEDSQWAAVKALGLKGVHETKEYRRRYPEGEAAAHLVGFTGTEDRGLEGVELAFQKTLEGQDGNRAVVKDRLGRVVEGIGEPIDAIDGSDVQLAIDAKIQYIAYQRLREAVREHNAKSASAVVIDVPTGEVLALANYPSFDPSQRAKLPGMQMRNRALTDTFEPGSTMKPFVAALAMQKGQVRADTLLPVGAGTLQIGNFTIKDAHALPANATATVAQIIQKSSNIGTVRMAMDLDSGELWSLWSKVGLGHRPDLPFPGAVSGRLRPHQTWKPIEKATMAYGYGLSASLFQLAQAYTVFAHDGQRVPLTMVKGTAAPKAAMRGERVLDADVARQIRDMLQLAAGPGGTAQKAMTDGYSVGGKTGTAYKQEGKGYATDKYRAWFVGLSPVKQPRVVVAVMVDEPRGRFHYGGDVAAPVFSQIVQQSLSLMGVAPDVSVKPKFVTSVPAAQETIQ
jgi:cell division protein FtsI (penicillin-binding protein 3)